MRKQRSKRTVGKIEEECGNVEGGKRVFKMREMMRVTV